MNIQEYISSGILEQYVLGTLSSGEEREVLTNAAQYPEIRTELDAIETALERYAESNAITPPTGLKDTILERINDTTFRPRRKDDNTSGKSGAGFFRTLFSWLPYILLPLLLLTAIWGYFGHQGNKDAQKVQLQVGKDLSDCRTERKKLRDTINIYRVAIGFVNDENTNAIAMNGLEGFDASTTIHTNSALKVSYFVANKLPKPPKGMQYQLWAIKDDVPVSMGVFDVSLHPIEVTYISNPQAYAVSLEVKGGADAPNYVRVVGAVKS